MNSLAKGISKNSSDVLDIRPIGLIPSESFAIEFSVSRKKNVGDGYGTGAFTYFQNCSVKLTPSNGTFNYPKNSRKFCRYIRNAQFGVINPVFTIFQENVYQYI